MWTFFALIKNFWLFFDSGGLNSSFCGLLWNVFLEGWIQNNNFSLYLFVYTEYFCGLMWTFCGLFFTLIKTCFGPLWIHADFLWTQWTFCALMCTDCKLICTLVYTLWIQTKLGKTITNRQIGNVTSIIAHFSFYLDHYFQRKLKLSRNI